MSAIANIDDLIAVQLGMTPRTVLTSPLAAEVYQHRELLAQIREQAEPRDEDRELGATVERITDADAVRGCLKLAADASTSEILVLRSGDVDTLEFDSFLRICAAHTDRGVSVRIVCRHRDRADLVSLQKIRALTDAGARIRTVSHVPRAAVVFDRSLAVLLDTTEARTLASCVRDPEVVRFLLDLFDHQWDAATPADGADPGYAGAADDLRQAIAGLMVRGFTDEVMARKLGMSVRTCRRHIAAMMRDLDAVCRFQAGARAARLGLVEAG